MWSFYIFFDFEEFLNFIHQPTVELTSGVICSFIITSIEISNFGFDDINRGKYTVTYDLIPLEQQLTLF